MRYPADELFGFGLPALESQFIKSGFVDYSHRLHSARGVYITYTLFVIVKVVHILPYVLNFENVGHIHCNKPRLAVFLNDSHFVTVKNWWLAIPSCEEKSGFLLQE